MNETNPDPQLPNPKPKRAAKHAPVCEKEGEGPCLRRHRVRFVSRRVSLLDRDNFTGGLKHTIDGLRHAGLIPEDTARAIRIEAFQIKVEHFSQEATIVEIEEENHTPDLSPEDVAYYLSLGPANTKPVKHKKK